MTFSFIVTLFVILYRCQPARLPLIIYQSPLRLRFFIITYAGRCRWTFALAVALARCGAGPLGLGRLLGASLARRPWCRPSRALPLGPKAKPNKKNVQHTTTGANCMSMWFKGRMRSMRNAVQYDEQRDAHTWQARRQRDRERPDRRS